MHKSWLTSISIVFLVTSYSNSTEDTVPEVKRPKSEADYSPTSKDEAENKRNSTSTPP
jgi:hypothetical protein